MIASNPWPASFPAWPALYILSKPYKAARGVSYGTIPVIQPRMEGVTMGGGEKERSDHFGSLPSLPPSFGKYQAKFLSAIRLSQRLLKVSGSVSVWVLWLDHHWPKDKGNMCLQ